MRNHRMRGFGSWSLGWWEAERLPPGPPHKPGCFFWGFIALVLFSCIKVALEGHPFALLLGLAVLAGAIQGASR